MRSRKGQEAGTDFPPNSVFLGWPFIAQSLAGFSEWVTKRATSRPRTSEVIHIVPAHLLAEAECDQEFARVLRTSKTNVPDGRWLELLTRNFDKPLKQIRGVDLLREVLGRGQDLNLQHFFLVPSKFVGEALVSRISEIFPKARIAGFHVYPFGELTRREHEQISGFVESSGANIVWFGISSPRQNREAMKLASRTSALIICGGAALEFLAGTKKSAPRWMQIIGLEWFFRFVSEPRRLWRRYLIGSVRFLRLYVRYRVRRGLAAFSR